MSFSPTAARRRAFRNPIEAIEQRRMLTAVLANGVLTVTGNERSEHIEVDINDGLTAIEVNIERLGGAGGDDTDPTQTFNASDVSRVVIDALDGNDDVAVDADLSISTSVLGGNGDDTLSGGGGSDYLYGGGGEDRILGNIGNDTLSGGASRNYLYGGNGDDLLNGSSSHDFLYGGAGNDRLHGGAGDDDLDGGGNVDRLYGDAGNDVLIGGTAIDRLYGGVGNDTLFGGRANDFLFGGDGTDSGQQQDADVLDSIESVI